jgi:catechol 2,3-dioxygenase-like lactoylglutathione lyase family enzyme
MNELFFDHIAIPVSDPEASLAFYCGILGFELVDAMGGDDWEGRPWLLTFLRLADGRYLTLSSFRKTAPSADANLPRDARHYCVSTSDLDVWKARLQARRISFRTELHGDRQAVFLEDPDGTVWEITSPATTIAPNEARAREIVRAWRTA